MSEWPELKPIEKPVDNENLRRLAWLIGGTAAEEWTEGHNYQFTPNPAVREALGIIVELDLAMAQKAREERDRILKILEEEQGEYSYKEELIRPSIVVAVFMNSIQAKLAQKT